MSSAHAKFLLLLTALSAPGVAALAEETGQFVPEVPVMNPPGYKGAEKETPAEPVTLDGASGETENAPPPENSAATAATKPAPPPSDDITPYEKRKPAGPVDFVHRSDDDLVLLDLRVGRATLVEGMQGYVNKGILVLPLSQLAEALQFPIKVMPRDGQAEGWFLARDNRFSLDATRREVIIGGNRETFPPEQVEIHDDDIYVDTTLLAKWFPLEFNFSFATQTVTVATRGKVLLPFEAEAQRAEARAGLGARSDDESIKLPRVEAPYSLYSLPFADVTYTGAYESRAGAGLRNDLNILATGDLFYMHSDMYLSASQEDSISDLRWTLSRHDPDGKIFKDSKNIAAETINKLEVRELQVGDVYTQQVPLSAFNQQGRGILIGSKPYDQATQFNRTTLQGDLQAGWEIELYRNDELLDFRRATDNGRYEFIDVPLLSGLNIIRLVFYGPFGQTREEVQRFLVSPDITDEGKSYFRLSATQQDTSIFNLRDEATSGSVVGAVGITPSEREAAKGHERLLAEYEYGLRNNISLFGSFVHLTTGDGQVRNYTGAGVATSLFGIYGRFDASRDLEGGGNAFQGELQGNVYGISISGQHQQFYDFISEFTESISDPITGHTTVRADAPFNFSFLPRMNTGFTGERTAYDSGRVRDDISNRLSLSLGRVSLSHTTTLRYDTPAEGEGIKEVRGELVTNFPYGDWLLRSNVSYIVSPDRSLDTVALTTEYHFDRDTIARLDVSRQMAEQNLTTTTVALNRKFKYFLLGASVGHDTDGNNMAGLTLSFGIGEDPRSRSIRAYPDYIARDGLAYARAYEDADNDGKFSDGDTALENAKFRSNRGGSGDEIPNENNMALLRNVTPHAPVRVMLQEASVDNPYLYAPVPGAEIVARPGVPVFIDVPLVSTSDVEGTAYIVKDGENVPAANVKVEIVGEKGDVVKETRSAFDGYYFIDRVPVGKYVLRVSPEQAERLSLIVEDGKPIEVVPGQDSIGPIDIVLKRK